MPFEWLFVVRGGCSGRDAVPSTTPGLTRVSSMVILGFTMNEALSFKAHFILCDVRPDNRFLVVPGLSGPMLYNVVRAITVARMLYAAPAWWGFAGQQEKNHLQSVM